MHEKKTAAVLSAPIDVLTWEHALARISRWAARRESRYVCICNAHAVVTAGQNAAFGRVVKEADMATPDGAPVAWMLRKLGYMDQQRINGPDLMWKYCEQAAKNGESVYLYGSRPETLEILQRRLVEAFPGLRIAGAHSPPFRTATTVEDEADVARINASGAGTVWVSLGCPKQEQWMATHRGRVNAVMIGVGAAFDYHAGTISRAPVWMQNAGLEWLHRLVSEPRRLWKRYLVTNTLFVIGATRQLVFGNARTRAIENAMVVAPLVSVGLVVMRGQEVLLSMRNNQSAKASWFVPGGRIFKNEPIQSALARIAETELGLGAALAGGEIVPQWLGAFEHFHADCFAEEAGVPSHYVVLGHELNVAEDFPLPNPERQHVELRWWPITEALASPDVHRFSKDYFQQKVPRHDPISPEAPAGEAFTYGGVLDGQVAQAI